jgi:hypothetical protein
MGREIRVVQREREKKKKEKKKKGKEDKRPCVTLRVVGRRWGNLLLAIPAMTRGRYDSSFYLKTQLL